MAGDFGQQGSKGPQPAPEAPVENDGRSVGGQKTPGEGQGSVVGYASKGTRGTGRGPH